MLPDLDLDIPYRSYLDKALANDDRRQFDFATMEFVARLHNGHTLFSDTVASNLSIERAVQLIKGGSPGALENI